MAAGGIARCTPDGSPGTGPRRGLLLATAECWQLPLRLVLASPAAPIFAFRSPWRKQDPGVTVSVMDAQAIESGRLEFSAAAVEEREEAVTSCWELRSNTALEGRLIAQRTGRTRDSGGSTEASIRITHAVGPHCRAGRPVHGGN